jgi:hypothetical protein
MNTDYSNSNLNAVFFFFCSSLPFAAIAMSKAVLLAALLRSTLSLQFLVAHQYIGHTIWPNTSLAIDFTVYSPINVTSIGFFDADDAGFNGTLFASILDRSSGRPFVSIGTRSGDARENSANPFHFAPVHCRLEPGVYSLISTGFVSDRIIATGLQGSEAALSAVSDARVVITAALLGNGSDLSSPFNIQVGGLGYFHVGATFTFELLPVMPAVPLTMDYFDDCEAVACAGLRTGYYNVRKLVRFCDNDERGGGWLRLWRATDSPCEASGWTSARNINANDIDPVGCSPAMQRAARCSNSSRITSPFAFREVRGSNWRLWGLGALNAFHSRLLCDGVIVWDVETADTVVWALAASGARGPGYCPCDEEFAANNFTFASLNATGPNWTCGRLPFRSSSWNSVFDLATNGSCTGAASGDVTSFQRTLDMPLSSLSVGLCKNGNESTEDIKLASGDLYVRATIGFDRSNAAMCTRVSRENSQQLSTTESVRRGNTVSITTASLLSVSSMGATPFAGSEGGVSADDDLLVDAIVGGICGTLVLVVTMAVCFVCWKRRSVLPSMPTTTTTAAAAVANEYGVLPQSSHSNGEQGYDDVTDVRRTRTEYESTASPLIK